MKIILGFFLCAVFTLNSFASPLIFKQTKQIPAGDESVFTIFDTAKYKQIRIGIKGVNTSDTKNITSVREIEKALQIEFAVYSAEEGELIQLDSKRFDSKISYSYLIDSPPSKIIIKIKGEGKYTVFIWGS